MIFHRKLFPLFMLLPFLFTAHARGEGDGVPRYLVLGFEGRELNGIQSRFLREKISWDLQTAGHAIVPVMEFEKFFSGTGEDALRKPGEKNIKRYAGKLGVDFVISGKIYPRGGEKPSAAIIAGTEYACEILLYSRKGMRFSRHTVVAAGKDDYFLFITNLSLGIVREIGSLSSK